MLKGPVHLRVSEAHYRGRALRGRRDILLSTGRIRAIVRPELSPLELVVRLEVELPVEDREVHL